jgi:Spy/CpxP family protein refolding chaperone
MNRTGALASVAALFFSGVAIGGFGVHIFEAHYAATGRPEGRPFGRRPLDELERRLDLTRAQRRAIEDIADENRRAVEEIRREIRPRIDQQVDETERRLIAVLSEEQRARFQELLEEDGGRPIHLFLGPPPPPGPPPPHPPEGPRRGLRDGPPPR